MKKLPLWISFFFVSCSSAVVRDVNSDPLLTVIISPEIDPAIYVQVRRAALASKKFRVIERQDGFAALIREQNLQHGVGSTNRFDDKLKYAHLARLSGARGVIVPYAQCSQKNNWLGTFTRTCSQELALIDANDGAVVVAVRGENSIPWTAEWVMPDWDEVTQKLADGIPANFEPVIKHRVLLDYEDESTERARRTKAEQDVKRTLGGQ